MRSLFSNKDLIVPADVQQPVQVKSAQAIHFDSSADFVSGVELQLVKEKIGTLTPSKSIWFKTDGAWSNIHLLEYILSITGAADVYFCTWAISEEAITRFIKWKETGRIKDVFAVIDVGLRNRKPGIYSTPAQAIELKLAERTFINDKKKA